MYAAAVIAADDGAGSSYFVRLENDSNVADNIVDARLESISTGVPLALDATERSIAHVSGLELCPHVGYDVVEEGYWTGLEGGRLRVRLAVRPPSAVRFRS